MEKYRAVIQYFYLKGKIPLQIHEDLVSILAVMVLLYSTVKRWLAEFKRG